MPFFTIGVTTYRRPEMLKECLTSLLEQSFGDFEVLIGNDFVPGPIDLKDLGVTDPRIKIFNYEKNKGELRNMNFLLAAANGEYFTWLADDDFLAKDALKAAKEALEKFGRPRSLLPLYRFVPDFVSVDRGDPYRSETRSASGVEFLREYFQHKYPVAGCYGFFQTKYLDGKRGMRQLGQGFSPYSDNLLAVEEASGDVVHLLPYTTSFIRRHDQSISTVTKDIEASESAQRDFVRLCREVFQSVHLKEHESELHRLLTRLCLYDFFSVIQKSGTFPLGKISASRAIWVPFFRDPLGYLANFFLVGKLCARVVLALSKRAFTGPKV